MFILKLFICMFGTFIIGCLMNIFMYIWENIPIVDEKSTPFYITRTYKEIQDGYEN